MKERPILFNADMVRAILDGRKTQTRRVVGLGTEFGPSDTLGYDWTFRGTRRGGKTTSVWQEHKEICSRGGKASWENRRRAEAQLAIARRSK